MSGAAFAIVQSTYSLYLGEISPSNQRGTLISLSTVGVSLGSLTGTIGETYLPSMKISSALYLVPCILATGILLWLPSTPYYLIKIDDEDSAKKSMLCYGSVENHQVKQALSEIRESVESSEARQSFADKLRQFQTPAMRKAMLLIVVLFAFPQLCGMFSVSFYSQSILENSKSADVVNPATGVIYTTSFGILSTVISMRLMDKFGRRFMLGISSVGTALSLTVLGLYFFLLQNLNVDMRNLQWLPITSMMCFTASFMIGFLTVPSTVVGEIFPTHVKSIASGVTGLTSALLGFVSSYSYLPLVKCLGEAYVFWIHAFLSILALPCALWMLPETKGKTLEQIQHEFYK